MLGGPPLDDDLVIWTIYRNPKDFPDGYVTRPWTITPGGNARPGMAHLSMTLEDARINCGPGLTRLPPSPEDDPTVVESWI